MRLDKFLCQLNIGTRTEVKRIIRDGHVSVNNVTVISPEQKIDENTDAVAFKGCIMKYKPYAYYMMNKPKGCVTATTDKSERTVMDVLRPQLARQDAKRELVPMGRLDKDTEGLLIFTDDGECVHRLLAPGRHVGKTYIVDTEKPLSPESIQALESGVDIGEKHLTMPAVVERISPRCISLTINEGKYHQIKRMLKAVGNRVTSLKRVSFGALTLDTDLALGEARALTDEEIYILKSNTESYSFSIIKPPEKWDETEAVIFDLDGTLVDSMWIWRQIDIEYLGSFGIPLPDKLQACIEGMSFHETALYFKERFDIPDSIEQIKERWNAMAWDKYANEVPLKPGVKAFLDSCRARGIKLGIATSNSRALMENVAKVHGLNDYFECIMTGCDIKKGKPAPDIYLAVAEYFNVKPSHCLVFEDIIPGIMAGKNAGMRVCAVEDEYSADIRMKKQLLADYYIADFTNIKI